MALLAFPPTNVGFLAACSKPEAFTGNVSAVGIALTTIDQVLRQHADEAVAVALSDRYTPPLLQVDEGFIGNIYALAARTLMAFNGYDRQAGADDEIVEMAKRADTYFAMCGSGAAGKRVTPLFIDSQQNIVQDGVKVMSNRTADSWARSRRDGAWGRYR